MRSSTGFDHQKEELFCQTGLLPVFLGHRIVLWVFENFDFLKVSLKNQQGFFVEIVPEIPGVLEKPDKQKHNQKTQTTVKALKLEFFS